MSNNENHKDDNNYEDNEEEDNEDDENKDYIDMTIMIRMRQLWRLIGKLS